MEYAWWVGIAIATTVTCVVGYRFYEQGQTDNIVALLMMFTLLAAFTHEEIYIDDRLEDDERNKP